MSSSTTESDVDPSWITVATPVVNLVDVSVMLLVDVMMFGNFGSSSLSFAPWLPSLMLLVSGGPSTKILKYYKNYTINSLVEMQVMTNFLY